MRDAPDVAALVADPARVAEVPAHEVPALLTLLAVERDRLAGVERRLLARFMAQRIPTAPSGPDRLLTITEAATLLRRAGISTESSH